DACRGAVLGDGARGDVEVDAIFQRRGVDAQLLGVGLYVAQGDLRRLLHDIAQLTGQGQPRLAFHSRGLDEEDVATGSGHGEPGGDTGNVGAVRSLVLPHLRLAQVFGEI